MQKQKIVPFLVRRYLRWNKSQPFISIAAIFAFLGVCVGVMVLIVAMALMSGFDKEFERKLFTMNYPITLIATSRSGISEQELLHLEHKFPHLKFSPFLNMQALSKSENLVEGAMVFGVDFEREAMVNSVFAKAYNNTQNAHKEAFQEEYKFNTFDIFVGRGLEREFGLHAASPLLLIFTKSSPSALSLAPAMKRFIVSGVFESGLLAYDKGYVYASLEALRLLRGLDHGVYDGIHIHSNNPQKDIKLLEKEVQNGRLVGWWEQNGNFFAALALEKRALFIVLMLIILVASLNIISSLLMTVMNRRREIALLLTMGASAKEIKRVFLCLGNFIGLSGIICGAILGGIILLVLSNFPIISLPADVYGSDKLPIDLSLYDLFSILFGSILIVFFSSYYPAKKATQIDPLVVLRNE